MATWNAAFLLSPADGDNPSAGAGKIRELKTEVGDRGKREHTWEGTTAADGVHRAGSAKVYFTTATPTLQPDGATALTTVDKGRLYYKSSTGSGILIHNGTGFVSTGVTLSTSQTIYGVKTFKSAPQFSGGAVVVGATLIGYSTGATGYKIKHKVLSIGSWNMDATVGVSIATGLTNFVPLGVDAQVRMDGSWDTWVNLVQTRPKFQNPVDALGAPAGGVTYAGVKVIAWRMTSGAFDGTAFNSTGFNRGWIHLTYMDV